jgi:hypothetical protein
VAETPERHCSNCGHELRPEDQFCPNYREPVHRTARVPTPEADVPIPPVPQAGNTTTPPPPQGEAPPRRSTANKLLVAGCAGLGLLVVLGVLGVVVGFLGIPQVFAPQGFGCSEEERSILREFPHYGGREPRIHADAEAGGCAIAYDTEASQKRVAEYYMEQLKAHGWKAEKSVSEAWLPKGGSKKKPKNTFPSISIEAKRGKFYYTVDFESHELYRNPSAGAHVAVHLGKNQAPKHSRE